MKKFFLTFVLTLALTASMTACTARPSDTGTATGNGNGSVMQDNSVNSRARGWNNDAGTMRRNGRYYANDNGKVAGTDTGSDMGSDIRRATDDMMNGVGNAVNDMTH